jgi:hypothetical protein
MKTLLAVVALVSLGMVRVEAQDAPPMPKPEKEHEWLKALEGEFSVESECTMKPGEPPMKFKGNSSAKSLGGFHVIVENKAEIMGQPWTGVLTLGFDPAKKKYVGTWVDSFSSYQWKYEGAVDAAGKVLTMDTEGPDCMTGKIMKFREKIELTGKEGYVFTSERHDDGKWTRLVRVVYTRKTT